MNKELNDDTIKEPFPATLRELLCDTLRAVSSYDAIWRYQLIIKSFVLRLVVGNESVEK